MSTQSMQTGAARQEKPVHPASEERRTFVHRALALLRQAALATPPEGCGWSYDALAAETGQVKSYHHAVLNGEKRCTLEYLATLPADVRARYSELIAKQYGFVVVKPASVDSAAAHLVAGLLGLLRPRMARADLERDLKTGAA